MIGQAQLIVFLLLINSMKTKDLASVYNAAIIYLCMQYQHTIKV